MPRKGERISITCWEVRRELANYTEGDVTPELRARIETHLSRCAGCHAIYDSVARIVRIIGETDIIDLPTGFSKRLYTRFATP